MFKLKMRLGQILHFIIRIYPLESHFYGFVKQSKILNIRAWFRMQYTLPVI